MYDLPFIKVHKSFDNLSQYQLCFRLRKAFSFIKKGLESASVCVLLNQIQITPRPNKLYRLDNMHAIQTFQYKQLAYYSLPPLLIFSRIRRTQILSDRCNLCCKDLLSILVVKSVHRCLHSLAQQLTKGVVSTELFRFKGLYLPWTSHILL